MRFREIADHVPMTDTHPWTVSVPLHPSLWSQFASFVRKSPTEFLLISKLTPEPDHWLGYVGCASPAARDHLEQVWG